MRSKIASLEQELAKLRAQSQHLSNQPQGPERIGETIDQLLKAQHGTLPPVLIVLIAILSFLLGMPPMTLMCGYSGRIALLSEKDSGKMIFSLLIFTGSSQPKALSVLADGLTQGVAKLLVCLILWQVQLIEASVG